MEYIDGHILKKLDEMGPLRRGAQCRTMSESLVDTMVALHAVDPDAVGLGTLGKKEDYLARQLHVWKRQIDRGSDRELPLLQELHSVLEQRMPAPARGRHRPRRLPTGQLRHRRRPHRRGGARLGALHPGRCPGRPGRDDHVVG